MSDFLASDLRSADFSVKVHGKWILAGEHSVLRGCQAIAFPVYGKYLALTWSEAGTFSSSFGGDRGQEFQLLFSGVFDRALEILNRPGDLSLKRGHFHVDSTLPVGAGLGASAALAVAVGRWFVSQGAISEIRLFEFCREIENLFHGESSGVDVAVAIESRGLLFSRQGGFTAFDPEWQPNWYISYSGTRGITSECVAKVKELIAKDADRGERLDLKMRQAVSFAHESLMQKVTSADAAHERFEKLVAAIKLSATCFGDWGLSNGELGRHLSWLSSGGAAAVKPTGSGGGGFALSLWRERPAIEVESKLIPVFKL
ncbi:MAG: hypothetical protein J0L82_07720 [Deltaproteobacteria bacterium]|nr:hypothetical protein [Deltaproteobacteria bacterium]